VPEGLRAEVARVEQDQGVERTIDDTHYLRIFVRKLRRKIEADPTQPCILLTELGVGYRLVLSDPPRTTATAESAAR